MRDVSNKVVFNNKWRRNQAKMISAESELLKHFTWKDEEKNKTKEG